MHEPTQELYLNGQKDYISIGKKFSWTDTRVVFKFKINGKEVDWNEHEPTQELYLNYF